MNGILTPILRDPLEFAENRIRKTSRHIMVDGQTVSTNTDSLSGR